MDPNVEKSPLMIRIERLQPGDRVPLKDGQTGTFVSRNWDGKPASFEPKRVTVSLRPHQHKEAVLHQYDPNHLNLSRAPIEKQPVASAADKRPDHTVRSSPERSREPRLSSR